MRQFFCFALLLFSFIKAFPQTQIGADIYHDSPMGAFGGSISMPNETTIAVNSINNSDGYVRVYTYDGTQWLQKGQDLLGGSNDMYWGASICMPSANTIAVGSPKAIRNGIEVGAVKIFDWNGNDWVQRGADILGYQDGCYFGLLTMPDSNTIAIGSPSDPLQFFSSSPGRAQIFVWNGNQWVQKGQDLVGPHNNSNFGVDLDMPDPNTIAVSASKYSPSIYEHDIGSVEVFSWNGTAWIPKGSRFTGDIENSGLFKVCMPDPNTVAYSAINQSISLTKAGLTKVFVWNGIDWVMKGQPLEGEFITDNSGFSIAMPDAHTIAIGAPYNDEDGPSTGHVRVYFWNGLQWIKKVNDINGLAPLDRFGFGVDMPFPGILAASALDHETPLGFNGHVRVFDLCNLNLNVTINGPQIVSQTTGATYQWHACDSNFTPIQGATNQDFLAINNGSYAVVIQKGGCVDTSNCFLVSGTSVEPSQNSELILYPNPTHGTVYIDFSSMAIDTPASYEILDGHGRMVNKGVLNESTLQLDFSNQPKGLYFLHLLTNPQLPPFRILKN